MVAGLAEFLPPAPDALDGEGGGIVVDAKVDPTGIGGDVIDAVGRDLAQFRNGEVVHPNRLGLTFGTQFATAILEVPDKLVSRPAGFYRQPLSERALRPSPHTAPIRRTRRSCRYASVRRRVGSEPTSQGSGQPQLCAPGSA